MTTLETVPSLILSSTPLIVTVCARLQLSIPNPSEEGEAATSPASLAITERTTSLIGPESNTTVKVSELPISWRDAVFLLILNPAGIVSKFCSSELTACNSLSLATLLSIP